jgi:hypothetical protein
MTDTLPAGVHWLRNLWASSGRYGEASGTITWTGEVHAADPVTIVFGATVADEISRPLTIVNVAWIDDGLGNVWQRRAVVIANGHAVHLPLISRR